MTLYEALTGAARSLAVQLDLALGFEGEVFAPPVNLHLRASIQLNDTRAASCGVSGLTRIDGALVITAVATAGQDTTDAVKSAQTVAAKFPRGYSLDCLGGEAVFAAPHIGTAQTERSRFRVPVTLSFYAILTGGC